MGPTNLQIPAEKSKFNNLKMSNHNQNLSLKTLNLQIEDNQLSTRRKLVESDKKPSNETIMTKKQGKKQSVLVDLAKTTANI